MKDWLPLMDYSMRTGVSLSTLRRYIKAGKVEYRVESGRYLLALDGASSGTGAVSAQPAPKSSFDTSFEATLPASGNAAELARELQCAREEIAELKTLIAFYEEKIVGSSNRIDA